MKVRFQAGANLDPDIGLGLQRRDPSIDYRLALGVIPDGMLVTNDLRMPKHFVGFIAVRESLRVFFSFLRACRSVRRIEGLLLCWLSWTGEEMRKPDPMVAALTGGFLAPGSPMMPSQPREQQKVPVLTLEAPDVRPAINNESATEVKIVLIQSLFRAREDVYRISIQFEGGAWGYVK